VSGGGQARGWEDTIARFWKGLQLGKGMTVSVHSWALGHVYLLGSSGRSALCFL